MVGRCRSLRAVDPFRGGSGVVYFVVNNKDYKLECTPRMRQRNKEEFSRGELDVQTQATGV